VWGVWFEKQFTDAALGRLPFASPPHLLLDVRLPAAATARRWDSRTRPDVRIGTEPSIKRNERSATPSVITTVSPAKTAEPIEMTFDV